jgi:hypothetical protein|tara:strand:- start:576 stop:1835 length:1260 start_codon:yes stop_codon:yes gene_type:complete
MSVFIKNILKERSNENGLPVFTEDEWSSFKQNFSVTDGKHSLAEYIVENNIPFPLEKITKNDVIKKFNKLKSTPLSYLLTAPYTVPTDKFNDYEYSVQEYCKSVIELGHYYNDISNYFHQTNRLSCNGYNISSPLAMWKDEEKLKKFNWTFWREGIVKFISEGKYREAFRLGAYVATQFKPKVAKYIYDRFNAKTILDSSCGWGDRLAGFYTSNAEIYVGCDPNPTVWETYIKQCIFYEKILGSEPKLTRHKNYFIVKGHKEVIIFCEGSEDITWPHLDYDLAFTSPPYFGTEKYAEGENEEKQSWFKYPTHERWLNEYLFKTLNNIHNVISDTGVIAINIIDVKITNKRYHICDPMTEYMESLHMPLQEVIGMKMKQRPKNEEGGGEEHMQDCFVEPIWIYGTSIDNTQTLFDKLFDA